MRGEQRPFLREKIGEERFFGARFLAREGVLQYNLDVAILFLPWVIFVWRLLSECLSLEIKKYGIF